MPGVSSVRRACRAICHNSHVLIGLALMALATAPALPQAGALSGTVFWESRGFPPRYPFTVELLREGKVRHRKSTAAGGRFEFRKVPEGRYLIRARWQDFILVHDVVMISAAGPNFASLMLPKFRAGILPFATISYEQLLQLASRPSQKKLGEADRLLQSGDLAGAAQRYQEVLDATPTAGVCDALGVLHYVQGRHDDARRMFESAIRRDPLFLLAHAHLTSMLLDQRLYGEAAAVAVRALEIDPKWATGHLLLASLRFRQNDLVEAAEHARIASETVRGKSPEPYLLLAKIARAQQDCATARRHLNRYLDLRTSARTDMQEIIKIIEACGSEP
jgi:Tfp pilus assembly protein PilF